MAENKPQVVIWGHRPEYGHTHSFVHQAFFKAFKHLGHDTSWLSNEDNMMCPSYPLDKQFKPGTIFLTEGQVDRNLPVIKGCKYILHNCDLTKYQDVIKDCLNMQVYTHDCLKPERNAEKVEEYIYYQNKSVEDATQVGINNRTLYMPWATNLLPHEIHNIDVSEMKAARMTDRTFWVGSVCGGEMGNTQELQEFAIGASKKNVQFAVLRVPEEQARKVLLASHTAPAIQGKWQVEKGYVPCRVFKNVSYGRLPTTNSMTVCDLFEEKLPCAPPMEMSEFGRTKEDEMTQKMSDDLVGFVRSRHTYINRIERLLEVL